MISRHKDKYQNYIVSKLHAPKTNAKKYCSILKTFYNGKKILIIPPLLTNDQLISDFKVKANYFNDFFASQCTPLNSNSKIFESQSYVNTKLPSVKFDSREIGNIIRSLDINKAHSHDNISIRMLKICGFAIVEPLTINFNSSINQSMFPDIWKNQICVLFTKNLTNKLSITTDQCHYY